MPARPLSIFSEIRSLKIDRKKLLSLIAALDEYFQPKNRGMLSIAFVHHERLTQMHAEFCGDPSPTDIITFPGLEDGSFGELCISPQAAVEYVKKHGGNPVVELTRYVIHGYLHLLGYDDLNPKAKRQMRRMESKGLELAKEVGVIFEFKR